jgi:Tat protein translocase TatB subunit
MPDILFILVLALVIFGPKRLPEIARQVAKFMAQFRMMRDDVRRQIENEILKIELEEKEKKTTFLPEQQQVETGPAGTDASGAKTVPENPSR